jgi:hypothetical protein
LHVSFEGPAPRLIRLKRLLALMGHRLRWSWAASTTSQRSSVQASGSMIAALVPPELLDLFET